MNYAADILDRSPRMTVELKKSLSLLDHVIGNSTTEYTPNTEDRTPSMTSGWAQMDLVIEWHLQNVSHLLQQLGSSDRIYSSSPETDRRSRKVSLLGIREDLLAMALDSQVGRAPNYIY